MRRIPQARRKLAGLLAVSLLSAGLTGCAAGGSDGEEKTIRYQSSSGGVIDLGEVADALGYFKGTGIKLKRLGDVQGGPESLRAVATGQVDYGAAFNGAIAKLASTGAPIKAVISYYGSSGKVDSSLLTLADSNVKTARDLIGKKVGVNTLGANAEAVLDTYLEKAGLSQKEIDEVTLVPVPGINAEASLRQKQVEATYLFGAQKEIALKHGGLRTLVTDTDLVGPYNAGSYVLRKDFIAKNPETAKQFVGGLAKALEYTQTHPLDKTRSLLKAYLDKHGRGAQAQSLDLWFGTGVASKAGVIADKDFTLWLDWLEKSKEVDPGSVKAGDIYTNQFNPFAKEG